MEPKNVENQIQIQNNISRINDPTDQYDNDKDLIEENLELLKCITNLRDLPIILNHRLMIKKAISLLLGNNILIAKPYFKKIKWEKLEKYKEKINQFNQFDFSDLNIQESTIKEIESLIMNNAPNISLSKESITSSISGNSINNSKKKSEKSNTSQEKKDNTKQKNKKDTSQKSNKREINEYDDSSDDITWDNDVEQRYSQIIEIKKNKNKLDKDNQDKKLKEYPENFIKDDDFRISNSLKNIKFNHYNPNDNLSGSLFEGTLVNYLYDIFNIITNGNLCFYRNQKYYHKDNAYELDFQISNLKIKDFLFFIGLIYPNIPTLDDLTIIDNKNIFNDKARIFDNINNYNSGEMCVDILGEITVDILNVENKKQEQINKYINLVQLLESNAELNHKFNFSSKNKKIIVIITDGNIKKFFRLFNEKFRNKKKEKKKIESQVKDKHMNEWKETSESLPKEQPSQSSKVEKNEILEPLPKEQPNQSSKVEKKEQPNQSSKVEKNEILEPLPKEQPSQSSKVENNEILEPLPKEQPNQSSKVENNEILEPLPKEQPSQSSKVENNEILEPLPKEQPSQSSKVQISSANSNEQKLPNQKAEFKAKKKLEDNIYLTLKRKKICHLFVFVKDKKNSKYAFNKKLNYKLSYLLKNSFNNPNQEITQKNLGEIQLLNELDFSNVYENFYKDILFSKKYDILQNCIKKIDGRFMKNVQNLYINFLKTQTSKKFIIQLFFNNFNFNSESKKILEKLSSLISEDEKKEATESIYNASFFELTDSDLYFNNYAKKDIKIDNYTKMEKISNTPFKSVIKTNISKWLENNNKNKKIFILNKIANNTLLNKILLFLGNKDSNEKFIFISTKNEKNEQLSSIYKRMFINYFDSSDDLHSKIIQYLFKENLKEILYDKLWNRYNYFDKILKNSIIISDNETISDNYLEQFLLKISQITSIYCNNDISQYKDKLFNVEEIKKIINEQNMHLEEFERYFYLNIISHLKVNELKFLIDVKLEKNLSEKLKEHKNELINVYYKFYERIFSLSAVKFIKCLIIDEVANFVLKK